MVLLGWISRDPRVIGEDDLGRLKDDRPTKPRVWSRSYSPDN